MQIKAVAAQVLHDARAYLDYLDPALYAMEQDLLFGASIGQHTRHFIEFFQCLLDQTGAAEPRVDYALRKRDLKLESSPATAVRAIDALILRLEAIATNPSCTLACSEHFADQQVWVHSNLERELIYNIEHTIHHLAIVKIGLAAIAPNIELPAHFGVAPSTVRYKQGVCAQ